MHVGAFELRDPLPNLRDPHLFAILQPWIDVGSVGTLVLGTLEKQFGAEELGRIAYLSYVCELIPALSSENTQTQKLYRLLQSFLSVLEQESAPVMATRIALEAKALTFAGLCPRLTGCACCGEPLENPVQFSATAGGVVHSRCGTGEPTTVKDVYSIEDLRRTPLAQTTTMSCPAQNQMTLSRFVEFQIARPLKSLAWVGEVELLDHRQEKT